MEMTKIWLPNILKNLQIDNITTYDSLVEGMYNPDVLKTATFTVPVSEQAVRSGEFDYSELFAMEVRGHYGTTDHDSILIQGYAFLSLCGDPRLSITQMRIHYYLYSSLERTALLRFITALNELQRTHGYMINPEDPMLKIKKSHNLSGGYSLMSTGDTTVISRVWGG